MKKNAELLFIRRMLENMLDQEDMEAVIEMSRRIDAVMAQRIEREASEAAAAL